MKAGRIVPLVLSLTLIGCQETDRSTPVEPGSQPSEAGREWKRVDAGSAFSFRLPEDMEQQRITGIDSLVGEYRSSSMRVTFDYGWYSDPLTNYSSKPACEEETESISGKSAVIVQCRGVRSDSKYEYLAAIHFAEVHAAGESGQSMKLTMQAEFNQQSDRETARKILESIAFK